MAGIVVNAAVVLRIPTRTAASTAASQAAAAAAAAASEAAAAVRSLTVDWKECQERLGAAEFAAIGGTAAPAWPAVERLVLDGSDVGEDSGVGALVAAWPNLSALQAGGYRWSNGGVAALADAVGRCAALETIELQLPRGNGEAVHQAARLLHQAPPGLARFTVNQIGVDLPGHAVEAFFRALAEAHSLVHADVTLQLADRAAVPAVAAFLTRSGAALQSLHLDLRVRSAHASPDPVPRADPDPASAPASHSRLHTLRLQADQRTAALLWPATAAMVRTAPGLVHIALATLDMAFADPLAQILVGCPHLNTVRLTLAGAPDNDAGDDDGGRTRAPPGPLGTSSLFDSLRRRAARAFGAQSMPRAPTADTVMLALARRLCTPALPALEMLQVGPGAVSTDTVAQLCDLVLASPRLYWFDVPCLATAGAQGGRASLEDTARLETRLAWSARRRRLELDRGSARAVAPAPAPALSPLQPPTAAATAAAVDPSERLPTELWWAVLGYLCPEDLVRCQHVARRWYAAVRALHARDRRWAFDCGHADLDALRLQLQRDAIYAHTPLPPWGVLSACTCGAVLATDAEVEALLNGIPRARTTARAYAYGDRHPERHPPARWEVLAKERALALELARMCAGVSAWLLWTAETEVAGAAAPRGSVLPWLPCWIHVPEDVVRPTTPDALRALKAALANAAAGRPNDVADLWQQLATPAGARAVYAAPVGPSGQRGHAGRDASTELSPTAQLLRDFEAACPELNADAQHRVWEADPTGWSVCRLRAQRLGALWRFAWESRRASLFHAIFQIAPALPEGGDDGRPGSHARVTAVLDDLAAGIERLHAFCHERLPLSVVELVPGLWPADGACGAWVGGLSPRGHLILATDALAYAG